MGGLKTIIAVITIVALIGGVFVFYAPQAKAASAFLYFLKEFIVKPLVRQLANALENKLVNKLNSLASGLAQGTPSFITNWRNYTLDSQGRGNDVFRSVLADATLCPYFNSNLKTAFGADRYAGSLANGNITNGGTLVYQNKTSIPGLPSFQNLSNCTLPANLNVNAFRNDFSKGGWAAWDQLIQPQNNFFGAYSLALDEQAQQVQTEQQSARDYSIAGQGFLGQKLSKSGGANPTGCTGSLIANGNRCIWFGKDVSPPKLLGDLTAKSLDTKIGRIGAGQELTDVILNLASAVVNGLTSKITNFIGQGSYDTGARTFNSGINFDETPQNVTPGGPGDPAIACLQACNSEEQSCKSQVGCATTGSGSSSTSTTSGGTTGTTDTTGVTTDTGATPSPSSGSSTTTSASSVNITCTQPDPVATTNCTNEAEICRSNCSSRYPSQVGQ